jgi:hypothetical protein
VVVGQLEDTFLADGVVVLRGAFDAHAADAIRDTVWRHVHRRTPIRLDDSTTWTGPRVPVSFKALKGRAVFAPLVGNAAVQSALDPVFGPGEWRPPPQPRAQILVTLPSPGPWVLPTGWHMDCGFEQPTWPVPSVKLFAFFGEVGPAGGGTLLLAGSHRLVDRYRPTLPPGTGGNLTTWGRLLRQDPWLDELRRGGNAEAPGRVHLGEQRDIDGIPVRLVELTGDPGDVVITHIHTFHCGAPNTSTRPRQMLGGFVRRAP